MLRLHTPLQAAQWLREKSVTVANESSQAPTVGALQTDSRCVKKGDVFMAWPGQHHDARQYIERVLKQGAQGCLVHEDPSSQVANPEMNAPWLRDPKVALYPNLKAERGPIASAYYEQPSSQLKVTAITGTNGKTTCAWWLSQALNRLGSTSAIAGTLGQGQFKLGDEHTASFDAHTSTLTTMEAVELQAWMRKWVNAGVTHLCMEASSIGLKEARMDGTCIEVGVFTNFTQDHLDYHNTMDEYWAAKEKLFFHLLPKASVINLDDNKGASLYKKLKAQGHAVLGYTTKQASHPNAELCAKNLRVLSQTLASHAFARGPSALYFDVVYQGISHPFELAVLGEFDVSNLLAVLGSLLALGYAIDEALNGCAQLRAAPGRMQTLSLDDSPLVVIDYAHTPDAIEKALLALQAVTLEHGGQLWCVMGCGGERDQSKRALMGAKAQSLAQHVVLTSDNPRHEDPLIIVAQIKQGLKDPLNAVVEIDRRQAILRAIQEASSKDVILIAGKGHENYQDILGVKHEFSDARVALESLRQRALRPSAGVAHVNAS